MYASWLWSLRFSPQELWILCRTASSRLGGTIRVVVTYRPLPEILPKHSFLAVYPLCSLMTKPPPSPTHPENKACILLICLYASALSIRLSFTCDTHMKSLYLNTGDTIQQNIFKPILLAACSHVYATQVWQPGNGDCVLKNEWIKVIGTGKYEGQKNPQRPAHIRSAQKWEAWNFKLCIPADVSEIGVQMLSTHSPLSSPFSSATPSSSLSNRIWSLGQYGSSYLHAVFTTAGENIGARSFG